MRGAPGGCRAVPFGLVHALIDDRVHSTPRAADGQAILAKPTYSTTRAVLGGGGPRGRTAADDRGRCTVGDAADHIRSIHSHLRSCIRLRFA